MLVALFLLIHEPYLKSPYVSQPTLLLFNSDLNLSVPTSDLGVKLVLFHITESMASNPLKNEA